MTDCNDIPSPSDVNFSPGELTLYGVPLKKIILDLPQLAGQHEITLPSMAIAAYGYAYEGHCYRFDKTKIMVFAGDEGKPANGGCGFGADYKMWRLQPTARIVELSTLAGTVQEVILDAGLPGRRSPATYRGDMQLVHRGGRLTT
jgi:hypothetical protein